jgi:hypothetical protein
MEPFLGPFTMASKKPFTMASIYRTPDGGYKVLLAGTVGTLWASSLGDAMALAYSLTSTPTLG